MNMPVMVIPIVAGALGMIPKELESELGQLEIEGKIETIQTTALLRSATILRRFLES